MYAAANGRRGGHRHGYGFAVVSTLPGENMAQHPPQGDWQDWSAVPQPPPYPFPYPGPVGFDPADPLVSNDFDGWWRRSFRLLKAAWRPLAVIQALAAVPSLLVLLPATVIFQDRQRAALDSVEASVAADTQPDWTQILAGLPILLAGGAVAGFFYLWAQLACQQVVVSTATGRTGNLVGPALWTGAKRIPALLGWSLLAIPVLIVALVLCFFPVLYVAAALTVLPMVVLLERGAGIGRCFQLFHAALGVSVGRIATMIGLSSVAGLLLALVSTVIDVTIGGSFEAPSTSATVINTVLQTGFSFVSYLVMAPMLVTTYADMRARREPFTTASLVTTGR